MRHDGRDADMPREVSIETNYTEMAAGSVLISTGRTRVICTASVEEGVPPFLRGQGRGWVTAEYAMLPGATPTRKPREYQKRDGRSVELSRLIGRSLRACVDMTRLGERTVTLDCDVIQADGGTRTCSVTGAFVALCLAVDKFLSDGTLRDSPVTKRLAAISCGISDGEPVLDLDYVEDSHAQADMNLVMTLDQNGEAEFVEVQGTGEGRPFSRKELDALLALGEKGIRRLMRAQDDALGDAASVIGKKPRLILASGNFGKLKEMRMLLGDRFDVMSMREAGFAGDIEEDGETFEQNALIKAQAILRETGCASVADDSGLEVDALGGRPGVRSARYAGVHGDDEANNRLLLQELENAPDRAGRYVCAIALCRPGKGSLVVRGACEGRILTQYRGEGGFGYDPLFFSDDLQMTFAEAPLEQKNLVSHRARAIQALLEALKKEESDV